MIESTKAFRKFANGKTWDQLDFRVQQQIRLAAILEQAYARYGDKLQDNVMTKQESLIGQLKDIKLNLSQAFLPIWDAILPALTRLAEALANVTEKIARFFYALRGWDYDERTKGINQETGAIEDQGDAYDDLAKSAQKARNQLAAFDEINLLGDIGGSGGGGSGGAGGGTGGTGTGGIATPIQWPEPNIPELPKLGLVFEPPTPPDAGAGAVATAVIDTVDGLNQEVKSRFADMWNGLRERTLTGTSEQGGLWSQFRSTLAGSIVPAMTGNIALLWRTMWDQMLSNTMIQSLILQNLFAGMDANIKMDTELSTTSIRNLWKEMLSDMLNELTIKRPEIEAEWDIFKKNILSIETPFANVRTWWHETLDDMQSNLNAYRPYLEWGWYLIGKSVTDIIPNLDLTRSSWSDALQDMVNTVRVKAGEIINQINGVISAWASMQATLGQTPTPRYAQPPEPVPTPAPTPSPAPSPATSTGRAAWVDNAPILGGLYQGLDWIRDNVSKPLADVLGPFIVPGGGLAGAGSIIGGSAAKASSKLGELLNALKGLGLPIPQFARGGIVTGPTLAMIGEAGTEAVVPLEDSGFVENLASAIGTAVAAALQFNSPQGQGGDIVINVDGSTFARVTYPYYQREQQRIGANVITQAI